MIPLARRNPVVETRGNGRARPVDHATPMPQETTDARAEPDLASGSSKLPAEPMDIDGVLREALHEVRSKWSCLFVVLLPVAALAVVLGEFFGEQGPFESFAPEPVMIVLLAATHALFALICHRIVLLGPDRMPRWAE